MDDRAASFRRMYLSGLTLADIGERYGITRERVRQVLSSRYGSLRNRGGAKLRRDRMVRERLAARDAKCMQRHGCTYAQYMSIRGTATRAFIQQRQNAHGRGIPWRLTLWEWWMIWQESGKWDQRGKRLGQYVMCRIGDTGAYEIGNVYIDTCSNNTSEGTSRWWCNSWYGREKVDATY